jgi:hypothetical protein
MEQTDGIVTMLGSKQNANDPIFHLRWALSQHMYYQQKPSSSMA